jgi:hypothetical protein
MSRHGRRGAFRRVHAARHGHGDGGSHENEQSGASQEASQSNEGERHDGGDS